MPLTNTAIKAAKPKEKPYKLSNEKGLYLLINPNGNKLFRVNYRELITACTANKKLYH